MSETCWVDSVMAGRPWPVVLAVSLVLWFCGAVSLGAVWVALRFRRPVPRTGEVLRRLTLTTNGAVKERPGGNPLVCLECERTDGLSLVAEDRGADGFAAWIQCPCGHESKHPLLTYPAVLMMGQLSGIVFRTEGG